MPASFARPVMPSVRPLEGDGSTRNKKGELTLLPIRINCTLEWEDEEQLEEAYGQIVINDGSNQIIDDSVFLYEWIEALITALQQARVTGQASVEMIDEPHPILITQNEERIRISYEDSVAEAESIDDIERALRIAIKDLLEKVERIGKPEESVILQMIRRFATKN